MKQEIVRFRLGIKGKEGWFIDYSDEPARIAITPNEGDVLLYMSAVISGESMREVKIVESETGFSVFLVFYCEMDGKNDELLIGENKGRELLTEAKLFAESVKTNFYH